MSIRRVDPRLMGVLAFLMGGAMGFSRPLAAQTPSPPVQQYDHQQQPPTADDAQSGDDMHNMSRDEDAEHGMESMSREGSGTAWLPDATPMYAFHVQKGAWQLMAHENVFIQFLHDAGNRGHDQFGSINWLMGMARRDLGAGRLQFRGMFSLEPWTIGGCGYPDLLASGERCRGEAIHDQQHPHDLAMELAAEYNAPLLGATRWQVYVAPAGEPALGPVAYPHRLSAMPNPLAPIAHHWLDATHITFGVITAGVYGGRWKAETSVFNGREPDEKRTNVDFGALDAVSGRVWFLPTSTLALQASVGRLTEAESSETGGAGIDVTRTTASATYHRATDENRIWATTLAWGRNADSEHASNAVLIETNVTLADRDTWFGRFEVVGKSAHDLNLPVEGTFSVSKLQGGYTRYLPAWHAFKPGLGFTASAGFVPDSLKPFYGSRVNFGAGVFATLRPAAMSGMKMGHMPMDHSNMDHGASGATSEPPMDHSTMPMGKPAAPSRKPKRDGASEEPTATDHADAGDPNLPVVAADRVVDPACAATIDLVNVPKATYQGKVYYFCSTADRDAFLKDPAAYLKKQVR